MQLLSPDLARFLGCSELPRTEVVKKIWEYVKENELQNPRDKREILLDEKLQVPKSAYDKMCSRQSLRNMLLWVRRLYYEERW